MMLAYGSEYIALIVAAVALIAAAAIILSVKKPQVAASQDDRVQNYATRGAYIPLLIGRDLLGAIHIWSQPDEPIGIGSPPVYSEAGLQAVCVGPGNILHSIYKDGKKVWEGPITPQSHPSGTVVTVNNPGTGGGGLVGSFSVYWGFPDDPDIGVLAAASNYGFSSALPLVMKILWNKLELGNAKRWPVLEYEVECGCRFSLANSPNNVPPQCQDGGTPEFPSLTWNDVVSRISDPANNPIVSGATLALRPTPRLLSIQGKLVNHVVNLGAGIDMPPNSAILADDSSRIFFPIGSFTPRPVGSHFDLLLRSGEAIKLYGNLPWVLPALSFPVLPSDQTVPGGDIGVLFDGGPFSPAGEYLSVESATYWSVALLLCWHAPSSSLKYACIPLSNTGFVVPAGYTILMAWLGVTTVTFGRRVSGVLVPTGENPDTSHAVLLRTRDRGGVNAVAALGQLMFSPFPYGSGKDTTPYDRQSMEECGSYLAFEEPYRASVSCTDGETADNVISRLLQDLGMMISFDPATGKYFFKLIRNPDENEVIAPLNDGLIISRSSTVNSRGLQQIDKAMFTFRDEGINYRDQPIAFDDDGNAILSRSQGSQSVPISTTTSYFSALGAALRRSQEILSNQNGIELEANHAARLIYSGLAFSAPEGVDTGGAVLRVMSVTRDTDTGKVKFLALVDNYDPPKPSGLIGGGLFDNFPISSSAQSHEVQRFVPVQSPKQDRQTALFVPAKMGGGLLVLRTRTTDDPLYVWASRDGVAYSLIGQVRDGCFAGELTSPLAFGASEAECRLEGNPADEVQRLDLTLKPAEWHQGRQVAVIGQEIAYLRRLDHIGGQEWVLNGLLRFQGGAWGSEHPAGTPVWAFSFGTRLQSLLFVSGHPVHIKLQRRRESWLQPLDDVQPLVLQCP